MKASDLKKLGAPTPPEAIEWRIGQAGKKGNGEVWAKCLAYHDARAARRRLNEVCGHGDWDVRYSLIEGGFICTIGINVDGEWVYKSDGAPLTGFEPFKGGISDSFKRACAAWNIGEDLYEIEESWAQVVQKGTKGARYAQLKDKTAYYWLPPSLPAEPKKGKGSTKQDAKPAPAPAAKPPLSLEAEDAEHGLSSEVVMALRDLENKKGKAQVDAWIRSAKTTGFLDRITEHELEAVKDMANQRRGV